MDAARVGALGHSSGGATVVALAGGVFSPAAMQRYCASPEAAADRGCDYARTSNVAPAAETEPFDARDGRIRAVVALDPALGPGFDARSLEAIDIPVLVVGAVDNDFLPADMHARRIASAIPGCSFSPLDGGEGHFVFLDECDADLESNGVPLCVDRPGVDRAAVHEASRPGRRGFLRRAPVA